ncbi:adenosine kinase 2-like isoform X1 [Hibiscus syriacus]|uniref:Adenosine kinase 2-like isoform X1 n=1 Tax=Hibiscus syriacus TaxID=106335 RepID=A0A6A3BKC1_HIBSY|nr:adenosine kinase 2-like isoform X1 [Hibiscus syriacus]
MRSMKLKLVVVIGVLMMVSYSCMASPRRAMLCRIYGQEQRHHVGKGKAVEARTRSTGEKNIDNHHNIPRQKYDDWGNNSPDSGGDNDDDGSA